ncbi:hypothetical protein ALO43_101383 [Pseudomonas tremae]|uniref:Uncharacterized protein n=1 Tax=Pseudomonas tremae TaxID=200454 RepID=A0AA40P3N4_9PSED|nr:hypothetical protein ALO77_101403 [Pseudomonas coronafaciens pv. garcae]KPY17821.1 hypothetical protein ALO89_101718 [Pseudomonas coronafaciens pv. porri]KPZ00004.1 hypothetical protein ALO43_101383 [Pseudomonas tremae]RMN98060.1 hypothetical protein ALQ50_101370 [Pseudomonas coronafaciens pv. coronafaciens]RMO10696.1 hypothetical protein ALQ48_100289 [Pseudomonas coronafaciens pv. zizaniae]RMS89876.1 hypothetical protein ALP57_101572 [Pseudomonas coronafaciens pv. oryzae]RMV68233.1 hypoth
MLWTKEMDSLMCSLIGLALASGDFDGRIQANIGLRSQTK